MALFGRTEEGKIRIGPPAPGEDRGVFPLVEFKAYPEYGEGPFRKFQNGFPIVFETRDGDRPLGQLRGRRK
jgi:hypothetical protein